MKKLLLLSSLIGASAFAHEPYLAPVAFVTENTQTAVISGYAEQALSSEYALKDTQFTVISPSQKSEVIKPSSTLKSATVIDLPLAEDGTYHVSAKVSYPLKYALHQKQWKLFYESTAEKAGPIADRDYVIADDFKASKKGPQFENVIREWSIESYISKNKTSDIALKAATPLTVSFSVHPNEIKATTPINILVNKNQAVLKNAQINILAKGATEDQAITANTNAAGIAQVQFPSAGQYLVEVTEVPDLKKKPSNQYFTIISLEVN